MRLLQTRFVLLRSRAPLVDPTFLFAGRKLVWAVPAFTNRHVFARSETQFVCASLEDKKAAPAPAR